MNPKNGGEKSSAAPGDVERTQPMRSTRDDLARRRILSGWLRKLFGGVSNRGEERLIERALRRALPRSEPRLTDPTPIGEGGMAKVERVEDRAVRRRVARKILLPRRESQLSAVQAFVNEAQITGQLDHPNIVPVYDFGRSESGRLFFTMKLLTGRTLARVVNDQPRAQSDRATLFDLLDVVLKVCDALAFSHERGVVHADVKPENVMVDRFGQVYLVDWGLARSEPRAGDSELVSTSFDLHRDTEAVGTPAYLSPEQATGQAIDKRTDIFGVGAMLYYVLTREAPYRNCTMDEALEAAKTARFPPLTRSVAAAGLPLELSRIVERAMERHPEDRYQEVVDLKRDLVAFLRGGKLPRRSFESGRHIVREGDVGEHAYIIVSGACEVLKKLEGSTRRIRTLGPGECFGETAILAASPRTASVVALEDTVVECISGEELLREVDSMKPWTGTLLRSLAERFRERETEAPPGSGFPGPTKEPS